MKKKSSIISIPEERIGSKILLIRDKKVMLDKDIAKLYGVPTKRLVEQVKRNIKRFPEDFMFQLTRNEIKILRSHFATSSWGGRRYLPYAFTEQGVAMLSSVLNSERAILVNIQIMRIFAKLRGMVLSYDELRRQVENMERKYDAQFRIVFEAIKDLLPPPGES